MNYFQVIFVLLIFLTRVHAQDSNTSFTATSWFWPLLSVCLALVFTIPCTLITIAVICHKKKQIDDSDESSIDADSSSSLSSSSYSIPDHHRHTCSYHRPFRSHYAGGFISPPPPYTATAEIRNTTSPLPPPYEPRTITVNPRSTPPVNTPSIESNANPPSINQRTDTILDTSSSVTNQSIQTFHV